jgi:hypothetical protein
LGKQVKTFQNGESIILPSRIWKLQICPNQPGNSKKEKKRPNECGLSIAMIKHHTHQTQARYSTQQTKTKSKPFIEHPLQMMKTSSSVKKLILYDLMFPNSKT